VYVIVSAGIPSFGDFSLVALVEERLLGRRLLAKYNVCEGKQLSRQNLPLFFRIRPLPNRKELKELKELKDEY
jgi:hypothetical protein